MNKKIVIFGGGSGLSTILKGLKLFPVTIVAIVSVSDNGGSSGIIRRATNMPAIGDLRKVYTALSDNDKLNILLNYRFQGPLFKNHPLGNIILLALYELENENLDKTLKDFEDLLNLNGKVLPVSFKPVTLKALYDGYSILGEKEIHINRDRILKLENTPNNYVNAQVINEILDADMIVYSAGSLYTSTIAGLSYPKIIESLSISKAKKVYIANIMTEKYETYGFSLSDHINEIIKTVGIDNLDIVIANNDYKINKKIKQKYRKQKSILVNANCNVDKKIKIIQTKLWELDNETIKHDSFKLARILFKLLYKE